MKLIERLWFYNLKNLNQGEMRTSFHVMLSIDTIQNPIFVFVFKYVYVLLAVHST